MLSIRNILNADAIIHAKVKGVLRLTTFALLAFTLLSDCTTQPIVTLEQTGYIPFTKELILKYGIAPDEYQKLQYFSSKSSRIKFNATTIVQKDTTIKKSGALNKQQLTARYSFEVNPLTPGIVTNSTYASPEMPYELFIQFDSLVTSAKYVYMQGSQAWDTGFKLVHHSVNHNDMEYELAEGVNSLLYVRLDDLKQVITNRIVAKGVKVSG